MDTRGLEKSIVVAAIYLLFFCFSAAVAFLLFKYIPGSEATAAGSIGGMSIKAGGAFGGLIISFWVLHWAYKSYTKSISPKTLAIKGNIYDEDNKPVPGATVWVDGVQGHVTTNGTGRFTIEVIQQREWTVHAGEADGFASNEISVTAGDIDKPVCIRLKKKA